MPIYEFECRTCGKCFEELVLKADEPIRCPECSGRKVRRLFSGFSVLGGSSGSCSTCSAKTCNHCQ